MTLPYRDPTLSVEARVADLLERMSLDEKLAQLAGLWVTQLVEGDAWDADRAAALLEHGIGHVTRIGAATGLRPSGSARLMNDIQQVAVERTRLGIPVVVHEESTGGFCARDATVFPQALGLASTWDPDLVLRVATVIREQLLAVGARHTLAPVLDVARDPRWGRVEETYGEDPVLIGTIGTAYVRGLQTDDLRAGVVATGKHFLGYAMSEGGMNHAPVQLGPRELREVYAETFAAAIRDAGLASIMNSYASIDGLPCAGSRAILTDLLRGELGFEGMVVADYGSVEFLLTHHHVVADKGEAAVRALLAGLDMELPALDCFGPPLRQAIDRLTPADSAAGPSSLGSSLLSAIDEAVARVLRTKFRLGLFEQPYVDADAAPSVYDLPEQRALARTAVARSAILLTNNGVLPLDPSSRVAVIGPGADDERLLQGDYHYPAHLEISIGQPTELAPVKDGGYAPGPYFTPHVTPLAGIEALASSVTHALGCAVSGDDRSGFAAAVDAATDADVAVVVVAGRSGLFLDSTVGEARDAVDLRLTGVQEDLVAAVAATGTPTVVVVMSGRVHTLASVVEQAAAVLLVWPPGEEGGNGIADVLFGAAEPGGRLPVTLPRHVGQIPTYTGHRAGGRRSMFYRDYTDSPAAPLFAFGHGLGYTTWEYDGLVAEGTTTTDPVEVRVGVTNTGARPGDEVVQLYVSDLVASVARPVRQLVGFTRVEAAAGERREVVFTVHPSRLAFYDEAMRFVVEPGEFRWSVGEQRTTCVLEGPVAEYRQRDVVATGVRVD